MYFGGIKYIHATITTIFSACRTETLYLLNNKSPFSFPPAYLCILNVHFQQKNGFNFIRSLAISLLTSEIPLVL